MIGSISAATLGYIHGNIKGARMAYKLYKNMPPYKRKNNHTSNYPRKRRVRRVFPKRKKATLKRKTKRKFKQQLPQTDGIHSGVERNSVNLVFKAKKGLPGSQKGMGTFHYAQNHVLKTTSAAGTQNAWVLACGATVSQCLTSSGGSYNPYQNNTALELMNPNLTNTGSSFVPTVVTPLNDRFLLKNQVAEVEITNMTGVATYCELYLCVAKTANASDPVNQWAQGYTDDSFGVAANVFPAPGTSVSGATGKGGITFPGAVPGETSTFRSMWKVKYQHKFELAGAASYQHFINIDQNVMIKRDQLVAQSGSWKNGVSWCLFVVQRGAVVLDITTVGAGNGIPTFGSTVLATIVTVKTKMQAVAGNAARLSTVFVADRVPANAATNMEEIINEVDGAVLVSTLTQS